MATLKLNPSLYTSPPKTAIPGARVVYTSMAVATTDMVTTQLIAMAVLPAGHRLMNCALECTDLDTNATAAVTVSVGILNTYYNQAAASATVAAAYNSGGQTNVGTTPALVSGQNIFTDTTTLQAGGRNNSPTLGFTTAIGVDNIYDRIVAFQPTAVPGTATAGTIALIMTIDDGN